MKHPKILVTLALLPFSLLASETAAPSTGTEKSEAYQKAYKEAYDRVYAEELTRARERNATSKAAPSEQAQAIPSKEAQPVPAAPSATAAAPTLTESESHLIELSPAATIAVFPISKRYGQNGTDFNKADIYKGGTAGITYIISETDSSAHGIKFSSGVLQSTSSNEEILRSAYTSYQRMPNGRLLPTNHPALIAKYKYDSQAIPLFIGYNYDYKILRNLSLSLGLAGGAYLATESLKIQNSDGTTVQVEDSKPSNAFRYSGGVNAGIKYYIFDNVGIFAAYSANYTQDAIFRHATSSMGYTSTNTAGLTHVIDLGIVIRF